MSEHVPRGAWIGMVVAVACAVAILYWCDGKVAHQQALKAEQAERGIVGSDTAAAAIAASRDAVGVLSRESIGTQLIRWVDRHSSTPADDRILVLMEVKTVAQSTKTPGSLRVGGTWVSADNYSSPIPELTDAAHKRLAAIMLANPASGAAPGSR